MGWPQHLQERKRRRAGETPVEQAAEEAEQHMGER